MEIALGVIIGIALSLIVFLAAFLVILRYKERIHRALTSAENKSEPKAKIVRVPQGDEKKVLDRIKTNKSQGKSTPLGEIYG